MTPGCPKTVCDLTCRDPTPVQRRRIGRFGRAAATTTAALAGAGLILATSGLPGYGRTRRSSWALGHAARWTLRGLGVRLETIGMPRKGPSLVVGNHVSFLDILALAASAPMRHVAKAEVGQWPGVGGLARRTGTIFLRRDRLRDLPKMVDGVTRALRAGQRVQAFPEGTTRCGSSLAPFHRSVFQAALDSAVVVTPVALSYAAAGQPTRQTAFLADETLLDALRRVWATPGLSIRIQWLPPIPAIAGSGHSATDRRQLAGLVDSAVARALGQPIVRPGSPAEPSVIADRDLPRPDRQPVRQLVRLSG